MLKKCSNCLAELPLDSFAARNKNSRDGLNGFCKTCINRRNYNWKLKNPVKCLCSNMLAQAKRRAQANGRAFDLTLKDLQRLVVPRCPILGTELIWEYGHGLGLGAHSPSLDRIDNSRGYTKDNVAIISHKANGMKNSCTVEELKAILNYIQNPPKAKAGLRSAQKASKVAAGPRRAKKHRKTKAFQELVQQLADKAIQS
jgi:hypothetical protein